MVHNNALIMTYINPVVQFAQEGVTQWWCDVRRIPIFFVNLNFCITNLFSKREQVAFFWKDEQRKLSSKCIERLIIN